ncbi:Oligopeptide transport system permease protein OppC [Clostridiaceae bacterium JG1575]|nr:Oligopeptide transport system permease protein OppC [Clostridiaceae bacterium JG1575]
MADEMKKNDSVKPAEEAKAPKKRFGMKKKKDLNIFQEEQIQTPWKTVVRTFRSNKLSMGAFILFMAILIFMLVAPYFFHIDLGYNEPMQANLPPSNNYMSYPEAMKHEPRDVAVGSVFGVGAAKDGQVYAWGETSLFSMPDLNDTKPKAMKDVVQVAAGYDHVLALDSKGKIWAWGNRRNGQLNIPGELRTVKSIKQIAAGYKFSVAVTEDGKTYAWGNTMNYEYNDMHPYQGKIAKVAVSTSVVTGLTKDGQVVYLGTNQNSYAKVPEGKFVDIGATSYAFAGVREDGTVVDWGNTSYRRMDGKDHPIPEFPAKAKLISGGINHFAVVLEDGSIKAWGVSDQGQTRVPEGIKGVKWIKSGFYQNYYETGSGELKSFGLRGYTLGTDEFGRDVLTRIVNGGRLSLTIGSLAVVISTFIGMALGGISGYFGGKVDMVIQRFSEVVASFPFLPTIILLNSIIGDKFDSTQKVYLIMILLGLLGWVGLMRLVRAQVLSLREQEFVTAARALGIKEMGIVFQHIIPNVISVIIVSATLDFAGYLLYEATLSFLGFGVQPPQPTWGNMLFGANNSTIIQNFWWRWVFPALILSICIICINLIGTGLDDAIDPKSQER